MDEKQAASDARKQLIDWVSGCIAKNEMFLFENMFSVYTDTIDFVTESINISIGAPAYVRSQKGYRESTFAFFAFHSIVQMSNGLLTNLLVGNLPVCFMECRLIIESLANCWYADRKFHEFGQFEKRLEAVQAGNFRTTDIIKEMESAIGSSVSIITLWRALSTDWVHAPKHAQRFVSAIEAGSGPPSWTLSIPIDYRESDIPFIQNFGTQLSLIKKTLHEVVAHWPYPK